MAAVMLAAVAPPALASSDAQPVRVHLPDGLSVANTVAFEAHGDLAFISQGKLLVLDGATGKVADLGDTSGVDAGPQFSPNGKWLAYDIGQGSEWLARADGADASRVAAQGTPQWLPDNLLLLGDLLWSVSSTGSLRDKGSARGLISASADGNTRRAGVSSPCTGTNGACCAGPALNFSRPSLSPSSPCSPAS